MLLCKAAVDPKAILPGFHQAGTRQKFQMRGTVGWASPRTAVISHAHKVFFEVFSEAKLCFRARGRFYYIYKISHASPP
jgi:hypothetical protein